MKQAMLRSAWVWLAALQAGCASSGTPAQEPPSAPTAPRRDSGPAGEDLAVLVCRLGDADAATRNAAFQRLLDLGVRDPQKVLAALPLEDADPERKDRLDRLRRRIPTEGRRLQALEWAGLSAVLQEAVDALFEAPCRSTMDRLVRAAPPERRKETSEILAGFLDHPGPAAGSDDPNATPQGAGGIRLVFGPPDRTLPPPTVRGCAIQVLRGLRDKSQAPKVAKLLSDPEPYVRELALGTLGGFGREQDLPAVLELLCDPDFHVRSAAILAVAQLGGAAAAGRIVPLLSDQEPRVRREAVTALGRLKAKESTDDVARLLADPEDDVRICVIRTLGDLGDPEAARRLLPFLSDENSNLKLTAVMALGNLRTKEAAPGLIRLLADDGYTIRGQAALALARMGEGAAAPDISHLLADTVVPVRVDAVKALEMLGDKRYAARIAALLEDETTIVQHAAAGALAKLAGQTWPPGAGALAPARAWWGAHKGDPEFAPNPAE